MVKILFDIASSNNKNFTAVFGITKNTNKFKNVKLIKMNSTHKTRKTFYLTLQILI